MYQSKFWDLEPTFQLQNGLFSLPEWPTKIYGLWNGILVLSSLL